jgi:Amt family ammonium transporter
MPEHTVEKPWPIADCDAIDSGTTAWLMTSMAFVLFMTPGLAFFYGGLVSRKSVLTIMMQCFISMGLVSIVWVVIGFSLAFGESGGGIIGNPSSYPFLINLDPCTPAGYPMQAGVADFPGLLFAGYQMMFAIICPALITGAFADRVTFPAYLVFIVLWLVLVYCPFAHWIWNPAGFLNKWGILDFAGGIVVHISAGFAALASIFVVGSRQYQSEEERKIMQVPHNRTFVALGTGMLWFGWFGFNGGSALASSGVAVFAIVNTSIACAVAMFVWIMIEWLHIGKPTVVGCCVGAIAGLATITPCAGFVRPWAAFLIGFIAACFCYACVLVRDIAKWDDALDVWAVHGMGGFIGSCLLGALADETIGGVQRSWEFFGKQLLVCCGTAVYSFVVSFLLLKAVDFLIPVVPSQEDIFRGLDASMHGEHAYDEDAIKEFSGALKPGEEAAGAEALPQINVHASPVQSNAAYPSAFNQPAAYGQMTYPQGQSYAVPLNQMQVPVQPYGNMPPAMA